MSVVVTGDDVGLVKVWGIRQTTETPQLFQWGIQSRKRAVAALAFADEARAKEVLVAQADGNLTKLQILPSGGLRSSNMARTLLCPISGGLFVDHAAGLLLSCSASKVEVRQLANPDLAQRYPLPAPIAACAYQHGVLAFGGIENGLKLWDAAKHTVIWRSKNVPDNYVAMRCPIYESAMCFMWPDRQDQLVVATGHNEFRLYDTRASVRPTCNVKFLEGEVRKMVICRHTKFFEHHLYTGDTMGQMYIHDVRNLKCEKGKMPIGRLKPSHAGSVRAMAVHPNEPFIVSAGLGRKMYVTDLKSRTVVVKAYLKQKCTALAVTSAPALVDKYQVGVDGQVYNDLWDYLGHLKRRRSKGDKDTDAGASEAPDAGPSETPAAAPATPSEASGAPRPVRKKRRATSRPATNPTPAPVPP